MNRSTPEADLPSREEEHGSCFPAPRGSLSLPTLSRSTRRVTFHIPNYVWCTIYTAVGGFLFGFDTGSIGPVTVMSQFQYHFFTDGKMGPTVQGLIVSSILITASIASLLAGPLSDRISRTRTISLGAMTFSAGSAIACSSASLPQLFVGRCIAGVGEGLFLSAITVYTVEIAPARARGRLGTVVQLFITIGIASGAWQYHSRLAQEFRPSYCLQATSSVSAPLASPIPSHGDFHSACKLL